MVDLGEHGSGGPEVLPDPEVRAPWWAWGFVAAVPVALLGLCCHWFAVPDPNRFGESREYGALSAVYISGLGPILLMGQGVHWFGALREWWGVPTERGWRGRTLGDRVAGPVARAVAGIGKGIRSDDPADQVVLRGAAALAVAVGCAALVLLGIGRWAVPNSVLSPDTHVTTHLPVHLAFGFWCTLVSGLLFVVFGLIGCVPWPLRRATAGGGADGPWWVLGDGSGDVPRT